MCGISIVVPVYNGEKYLKNGIEMIINQTFKNFELIIIDDGSIDNSEKIYNKFLKLDSRIKAIKIQNSGAWAARNVGIDIARGKYIMFLDSDDEIDKHFLEKMYNCIESNNYDLVICGQVDVITRKNKVVKKVIKPKEREYLRKKQFLDDYINLRKEYIADIVWNKIYKTHIIKDNNIRFKPIKRGEDVEFNINYYDYVNSCKVISEALYYYNVDGNNPPWSKYSDSYLKCIEYENKFVVEKLKEWNVYNKEAIEFQSLHLFYGIIGEISRIIMKQELSLKQKSIKINELILKDNVKIATYQCVPSGIYTKILVYLIKKRKSILVMFWIKFRLKIKEFY